MRAVIRRADANQPGIVAGLRAVGATVQHLHTVGQGCPDLLVGYRGRTYLMEAKSKRGKLTPDETQWHRDWRGAPVHVVRSVDDALRLLEKSAILEDDG